MKPFFILLLLTSLFCVECKKVTLTRPLLTGRLIITGPCEHYVVQLLKGSIDTANIESSWFDSSNDSTYTNVFTVANFCSFGNFGLQKGDVFTFEIDSASLPQYCPICMIYVSTPPKQNTVINVQKVN